jgi:hypothetical protein
MSWDEWLTVILVAANAIGVLFVILKFGRRG